MKKLLIMLLCVVLLLSGCSKQKAESYYEETGEGVSFKTEYKYYFSDEKKVFCVWENSCDETMFFHDTFQLHELGNDGEWYVVGNPEEVSFITIYSHGIDPETESRMEYDISLYTDKLTNGSTYRISSYYYDSEGNNYQVFAEFTCDNKLAEEEMYEISDGIVSKRDNKENYGGELIVTEEEVKDGE